ncbi:hypothetical protein HaLaN_31951, partial [Haematococcus lacustris]
AAREEAADLARRLALASSRCQSLEELGSKAEQQHEVRVRDMAAAHQAELARLRERMHEQEDMLETQRQQLEVIYNA